jgi:hypothetical protein
MPMTHVIDRSSGPAGPRLYCAGSAPIAVVIAEAASRGVNLTPSGVTVNDLERVTITGNEASCGHFTAAL